MLNKQFLEGIIRGYGFKNVHLKPFYTDEGVTGLQGRYRITGLFGLPCLQLDRDKFARIGFNRYDILVNNKVVYTTAFSADLIFWDTFIAEHIPEGTQEIVLIARFS